MPSTYSTALSGLNAAQLGLATTSHNIANVNTEGYTRQRIDQSTSQPQLNGNLWVGSGTQVDTIKRIQNDFINGRLQELTSENSRLQTYHSLSTRLDNMMAADSLSLTPAMQEFFNAVDNLNSDPASQSARQVVIDSSENLASRFHTQFDQLDGLYEEVNSRIKSDVQDINSKAASIARLNEEIIAAKGKSQGLPPNDLLDQRDQLLNDLSTYIDISTIEQDSGNIDVYIGNGISLVVGNTSSSLTTTNNVFDAKRVEVAIDTGNGNSSVDSLISGGTLGGALDFRREALDSVAGELGRLATVFATAVNAQHAEGTDLYGQPGQALFDSGEPLVLPLGSNTGTAGLEATIADTNALTISDYRLTYDGTNYITRRLSDNQETVSATMPVAVDGVTFNLTGGAMASGDSFEIRPTFNAGRDLSVEITDTNRLAVGVPVKATVSLNNSGGAEMAQPSIVDASAPDLLNEVNIVFNNATSFNVVDVASGAAIATNVAYSGGDNIDYNGWRTQISGIPNAGDTFTISQTVNGVSDNRNGLELVNLQDSKLISGHSTIQEGISNMVGRVGSMTRQVEVAGTAQENLLNQTIQERDSISGVNLDEEAINLTRYQKAYQASAQVLATSNTLFDSILAVFR